MNGINIYEAPEGFLAALKPDVDYNICTLCDARKLCQENKDNWCLHNHCMSYTTICEKSGQEIKRVDGQSVIFKRIT